jgi:hypothetical protein
MPDLCYVTEMRWRHVPLLLAAAFHCVQAGKCDGDGMLSPVVANMHRLWQCNPSYKCNKQQLWPDVNQVAAL